MKEILIIEDDIEIRNSLRDVLEIEGYDVSMAKNGEEAISYLKDHHPSAIILDMMMPVMNGYEFRHLQLQDESMSNIPTAILSAEGNLDQKVKDLGIEYVLKKPIDLDNLISTIEQMT